MTRTRADAEWLDFVAELMATPRTELPDDLIAHQLGKTFELVGTAYETRVALRRHEQRLYPLNEQFGGHRAEIGGWAAEWAPTGHPLLRYYLATADYVAMPVHEVPDRFADRRVRAVWQEIGGAWGVPSQLALPVFPSAPQSRFFILGRVEPFRPGEVALARRLHRLLAGLDRQMQALARFEPGTGAVWERASDVRLTARELGVLALVAEGLTAATIARRLLLAERTVRKHLERCYAKLEVSDRVSAVLRAQRLGLLTQPPAVNGARSSKAIE
jgi:DNA-binding CsgD family transcriptional regulator